MSIAVRQWTWREGGRAVGGWQVVVNPPLLAPSRLINRPLGKDRRLSHRRQTQRLVEVGGAGGRQHWETIQISTYVNLYFGYSNQ